MMAVVRCFACNRGPALHGISVYRVNALGERPAVWACADHIKRTDAEVDPEVKTVVHALEKARPR